MSQSPCGRFFPLRTVAAAAVAAPPPYLCDHAYEYGGDEYGEEEVADGSGADETEHRAGDDETIQHLAEHITVALRVIADRDCQHHQRRHADPAQSEKQTEKRRA